MVRQKKPRVEDTNTGQERARERATARIIGLTELART